MAGGTECGIPCALPGGLWPGEVGGEREFLRSELGASCAVLDGSSMDRNLKPCVKRRQCALFFSINASCSLCRNKNKKVKKHGKNKKESLPQVAQVGLPAAQLYSSTEAFTHGETISI